MSGHMFAGTGVATITPFIDGAVDWKALDEILEYQISEGVDYLVCLGTTGEAITLSHEETQSVLKRTIEVNAGRTPLVFGIFGGNNTAFLANKLKHYDLNGVDAILSSSPAYNKPTQPGIIAHYQALADVSSRPIIIYNVPGRTGTAIAPDTTIALAKIPEIIGIKDATGDLVQATYLSKHLPEDFLLLSGDDPTALPFIACGGHGVISVIANAYPRKFSRMVREALAGNFASARVIHLALSDIHPWLYAEGNPAGIKGAMEILGFCNRSVRLPIVPLSEKIFQNLEAEMKQIKFAD